MERSWWGKFALLVCVVLFAGAHVYPTVANLDLTTTKFPVKHKVNLGLDLQGGLYMVMGVDFNKVYKDVLDRQMASLQDRLKEKNLTPKTLQHVTSGFSADDSRISFEFDPARHDEIHKLIKDEYWTLRFTQDQPGKFELGLAHTYRAEVRERTIAQSIEVIRNRIDEFGVSEPSITSQGTDRLVVELPGVKEIDRAKELIGRTAKLEFKMVDDKTLDPSELAALIAKIEKDQGISFQGGADQKFSDYVHRINEAAKGKVPAGTEIAFERQRGVDGEEVSRIPYLLKSRAEVTGQELQDAQVQFDPETQVPNVGFTLNPRGATLFDQLTAANIGQRMAIVLDGIVHSAPVIQSRIGGGRGQITLGRGNSEEIMKEARDLAIVLRAGALPAQLEFMEQRVIGPSLGADSIQKGIFAALVGALGVIVFMVFYYRLSGLIAALLLGLNILFLVAILVGIEATLTLPGIAGIALTVGMAVDSLVLIYERIREELAAGKSVHAAIDAGFQKAFSAIVDANVTTAAAAIVLLMYGTGPLRGFAVTMLIGIATTLFMAVFVCRLVFDFYLRRLENRRGATLSI